MHNAKIAPTPILSGYVPQENKGAINPAQCQKFQSVIRSLLYLMLGMHPDIAFVVIKMSQFLTNPSQDHLDKAMYIMHYLIGTQDVRGLAETPLFVHIYTWGCRIYSQSAISETPSLTHCLLYTRIP